MTSSGKAEGIDPETPWQPVRKGRGAAFYLHEENRKEER
jgi:hypothetical protein